MQRTAWLNSDRFAESGVRLEGNPVYMVMASDTLQGVTATSTVSVTTLQIHLGLLRKEPPPTDCKHSSQRFTFKSHSPAQSYAYANGVTLTQLRILRLALEINEYIKKTLGRLWNGF